MEQDNLLGGKPKHLVENFLSKTRLARLGTTHAKTQQPHVTPVWYAWDGTSLWISAYSSTRKMRDLFTNQNCSVLIDAEEAEDGIMAVLMEGKAVLHTDHTDEMRAQITDIYKRYKGEQGVLEPELQEWIHSPENVLIQLTPKKVWCW